MTIAFLLGSWLQGSYKPKVPRIGSQLLPRSNELNMKDGETAEEASCIVRVNAAQQ